MTKKIIFIIFVVFMSSSSSFGQEIIVNFEDEEQVTVLNEELRKNRKESETQGTDITSLQTTQSDQGDSIDDHETSVNTLEANLISPLYDSGWTSISTVNGDNAFSWTDINHLPYQIMIYFSTSNSGDGANVNLLGGGGHASAAVMEVGAHSITSSSCDIRLKETPQYIKASDSSENNMTTSHYLKVLIW